MIVLKVMAYMCIAHDLRKDSLSFDLSHAIKKSSGSQIAEQNTGNIVESQSTGTLPRLNVK